MNTYILENNQRYLIKQNDFCSFVVPKIGETLNVDAFTYRVKVHQDLSWWEILKDFFTMVTWASIFDEIKFKIKGKVKDIQYHYCEDEIDYNIGTDIHGKEILIILDNPKITQVTENVS